MNLPNSKTLDQERARRRRELMRAMGPSGVAVIPSASVQPRNRDVDFPFRQDSDFYYLTGFVEPEALLVLAPGREQGEVILFCRERDKLRETWDGRRVGVERAPELLGVDHAFPIGDAGEIVPGLLEGREQLYYPMGRDAAFDTRVIGWVNRVREKVRGGVHAPREMISLDYHLHEMRLIKSREEQRLMRRAGKLSAQGHVRAMQVCKPGMNEYQLEAEISHVFGMDGCGHAYPAIVGGGDNGCILHYTENNQPLRDGDLVLIDAGAEYAGYAGDITRTFPVNGRYSEAQRELYELVLAAQAAAMEKIRPGAHWNDYHDAAVEVLTRGLVELGIIEGDVDELIKNGGFRDYYMHRTGHWLGMDVHDVGEYKIDGQWRVLEPGMVLTVEPGLYVALDSSAPEKYRGIGIRIEDDVLVTKDGCEVLTADVPKAVDEIEALMAAAK
jgi:Xaa-Pro aminopeptidase